MYGQFSETNFRYAIIFVFSCFSVFLVCVYPVLGVGSGGRLAGEVWSYFFEFGSYSIYKYIFTVIFQVKMHIRNYIF